MFNKNCLIIAAAIFCSCILGADKGVCGDQDIKITQDIKAAIEVNNVTCIVSEDDIIPAEAVKYEYNGRIYNFCCGPCVTHFKKHPDKFVHISDGR